MYPIQFRDVPLVETQLLPRSLPIPQVRLDTFLSVPGSVVARSDSSTTSSSQSRTSSCGPKDTTGPCERSVQSGNNTTMPIVLGVVIPLTVAFTVLIILHRRHVKKLRREDADDRHKSLDFGMDGTGRSEKRSRRKKNGVSPVPEMSFDDVKGVIRRDRGVSMDMGMSSPYLLPPELHHSRESLHSLSRSMHTGDDKYRATTFIPDDGSIRSPSSMKSHWDDSSTYTGSSRRPLETESTKTLLRSYESPPAIKEPLPVAVKDGNNLLAPGITDASRDSYLSTNSSSGNLAAMRASNNYLGAFISGGQRQEAASEESKGAVAELDANPQVQAPEPVVVKGTEIRRKSIPANASGFDFGVQELPAHSEPRELAAEPKPVPDVVVVDVPFSEEHVQSDPTPKRQSSVYEQNTSTFAKHPNAYAWPDDNENRESTRQTSVRTSALRVQPAIPDIQVGNEPVDYYEDDDGYDIDAYKEALGYDPRLLTMGMRPLPPDDPSENPEERALRIRSFYKEYFDEAAKPGGGNRVSYFDGGENYIDDYYGTSHSSPYGSRGPSLMRPATQQQRHRAMSNGSYGPRAFSSASGRYGRPQYRPVPKKRLPPPAALNMLPTPYKLQDDSMLPNPMDYAPPQMFKNQRSGTPDGMRGGLRPYSPSTHAYNPLVSSFDDLAALPSPHALRKSGTFTSLDFAPPRFATSDKFSDTGSIRSNRSGVSAMHQHNIRTGAYRVSRIPREVAGTKNEIATALRPQWNMNR